MLTAAFHGNKDLSEDWLNPYQVALEAQALPVTGNTARLVLQLLAEGRIPAWAAATLPLRLLRYIAA